MLEQVAHFNDLSPALRKKLTERIESYGKEVTYRFPISHQNPDPEKYNGKIIWPSRYTLDPIVFDILDKEETRDNKSKQKRIGLVDKLDEKGIPVSFKRIRVLGQYEGEYKIDLETPDGIGEAMYMELHPKTNEGLFRDSKRNPVAFRVDHKKDASENRKVRNEKRQAMKVAEGLSSKEVQDFAAAMTWNEHEDIDILRDKIEKLAEETPVLFNDLVNNKKMEYQATIKRALDANVIGWDPVEQRFLWASNQQVIVVLGFSNGQQNEVERFADWLMTNGNKGGEVYKKLKSLLK